jgi:hypothetical protein
MPFKGPGVWAEDNPLGIAISIPPVVTEIKPGVTPVRVRQYPILMRAQEAISQHLQRFLNPEPLSVCLEHSLAATSEARHHCPVQDLRAVNQTAVTVHPLAANPYTLLALITAEATCFSCLDLKMHSSASSRQL